MDMKELKQTEKLNADTILIAEFNYASQNAFQANEDRVRIFNFVFANLLTLGASLLAPIFNLSISPTLFALIFFILFIIGILAIVQLIKLRSAWESSVRSMNHIKEFYVKNIPDLEKAFLWKTSTIPSRDGVFNISFIMALILMIINSFAFTAVLHFTLTITPLFISIYSLICFVLQLLTWFYILNK